ncbi:MAG TPA: hypothetical protein VFS43_18395 [Polyangiaceae bacterium]|nr:hypothetical protein [Polyangiaceae bacterium]
MSTPLPSRAAIPGPVSSTSRTSTQARALFAAPLAAAIVGGFVATSPAASVRAAAVAGEDLTCLLRGMAALKVLLALAAVLGVFWRLGAPVSARRFVAYALACEAMALGPGLIWGMVYIRTGAALLHGGLLVSLVVLWRDPSVGQRLADAIERRRRKIRL